MELPQIKRINFSMNLHWFTICCEFWHCSSFDSLISHSGWGLSRMMVWRGFAVTLGWNTFFLMLATVILKLRTWEAQLYTGASDWVKWCPSRPKTWLTHGSANQSLSVFLICHSPKTGLQRSIRVKLRAFLNQLLLEMCSTKYSSIESTDNVKHSTAGAFHTLLFFSTLYIMHPSRFCVPDFLCVCSICLVCASKPY